MVGALARTPSEAIGYMTFAAVLLGLLGGAVGQVSGASSWMDRLSKLTPHRWLIDGFRANSVGELIVDLLPAVGVILAFALVTGLVGLLFFRRQVSSP